MEKDERLIIGIAGGTGSGKTTLTRKLVETFGSDVAVLCHDSYYKAHDDLPYEERVKLNYDCPEAFDTDRMVADLKKLKAGQAIDCPVYDFSAHNRSKQTCHVESKKVIVVEGILIFADPRLCDLMNIKIFVDTDADVRLARRIKRDMRDRGRSLESVVVFQYVETVKPMHEKYVEPSKKNADIVVLEGGKNMVAIDLLLYRVQGHIDQIHLPSLVGCTK